jgi:hypothetical protein
MDEDNHCVLFTGESIPDMVNVLKTDYRSKTVFYTLIIYPKVLAVEIDIPHNADYSLWEVIRNGVNILTETRVMPVLKNEAITIANSGIIPRFTALINEMIRLEQEGINK